MVAIAAGAGAGYLVGSVNEHTITSVSTVVVASMATTTFFSTVLEATTTTFTATTTCPFGVPNDLPRHSKGVLALDGETVLSPTMTFNVTN